jgi:uncharacterized protein GlcG (DUF336 family)
MNMFTRVAATALLATGIAGSALAEEKGALVTFKLLTPDAAVELAQAALADCRKRGFQVAVAVVDRFGTLQALIRDRFAGPHTPETARRKAWTAVSFRTDTLAMADFTATATNAGVRFVDGALMVGGGVPVEAAGSIVAGVGVSGAPGGAEDDACARTAIEAMTEKLEF